MNNIEDLKQAHFVVFCLESYKKHKKLSGAKTLALFEQFNLTDYLTSGYDVLHTLGEAALINDISDFIKQRSHAPN